MKITKISEEITSIRKTTEKDFEVQNGDKTFTITLESFVSDGEDYGYDSDERIYIDGSEVTDFDEWVEKNLGKEADADELLDTIREQ